MDLQHVQKKFDSDCVIRWLQKWREMLFTTRVVSLLTIVSVFFLFYYESIYCFFLFRISCANLLQTNKKHCSLSQLYSTRRRGPLSRCDVPSHTSSPTSLLWFPLFSTFSLHGILLPVKKALCHIRGRAHIT